MIRELVQTTGVAELTVESTKTESSAIDLYQKPEGDRAQEYISVDATMVTIHTGWYLDCTQEFET
jgi:pyridoxine 5'-phosphate synthase PdxJ